MNKRVCDKCERILDGLLCPDCDNDVIMFRKRYDRDSKLKSTKARE